MKELIITSPAHLQVEIENFAKTLGVSVDALIAYFFATEVVYT